MACRLLLPEAVKERLLSLCVVARDEERLLPRCLRSAEPFVDEIVLVDTGSTDATARVAEGLGARVFHMDWTDDFARARNAALDRARGEFVLVLDADEWIEGGPSPGDLRGTLARADAEALAVEIADRLDEGGERRYPLVRLFRNRPEYRYEGAVHEQITPSIARRLGRDRVRAIPSGLLVGHDGYLQARRVERNKTERNVRLLRAAVAADGEDAAARYFLARELVAIKGGRAVPGRHLLEALEHLEWIARRPDRLHGPLRVDAARLHGAALLAQGRAEEALILLDGRGDEGVACELLRADAQVALASGTAGERMLAVALRTVESCYDRETRARGPFAEPALAGPIARARGAEVLAAMRSFERAREQARQATEMRGGGAAGWNALAVVERAAGRPRQAVRASMEAVRVDPTDPWAWAALGETLLAEDQREAAFHALTNASRLAEGWPAVERSLARARGHHGAESG